MFVAEVQRVGNALCELVIHDAPPHAIQGFRGLGPCSPTRYHPFILHEENQYSRIKQEIGRGVPQLNQEKLDHIMIHSFLRFRCLSGAFVSSVSRRCPSRCARSFSRLARTSRASASSCACSSLANV